MNICLVTMEWPPCGGGIGTYMFNLAGGLQSLGHKVTVLTHEKTPSTIKDVEIVQIPITKTKRTLENKILRWRWEPHRTWAKKAWETFKTIRNKKNFDIIETAEYGAWARHFIGNVNIPIVVRCHTPAHGVREIVEHHNGNWKMPLWLRCEDSCERWQTANADAINCPSHVLANHLSINWFIPSSRFTVVPNPIDTKLFHPNGTFIGDGYRKKEILYVGRFQFHKGIFDMAAAIKPLLAKYPDLVINFVGMDRKTPLHIRKNGRMVSEEILMQIPQEHRSRVKIPGKVPLDELISYQQHALCAVVPSRGFESFSYTVVEAMSCGCPVVATHCGGPTEIITHQKNGILVAPGDIAALADSVERLIIDEPFRKKIAAEGRRTVEQHFSIPVVVPKVIELYRQVIANYKKD